MFPSHRLTTLFVQTYSMLSLVTSVNSLRVQAQEKDPPAAEPAAAAITIPDEPKAVDPATLFPEPLAARASVRFKESSLNDVAKWVQGQTKINVNLDVRSLQEEHILVTEPVIDELKDDPIYLLLDRLRNIGVAWRLSDGIIHLTAIGGKKYVHTVQYNVGDLFDTGYEDAQLQSTIVETIAVDSWSEAGGEGGIVVLGDVLFVRQTDENHRRVAGLVAALRQHGRRTLTYDPPQHEPIREALRKNVTLELRDKPLGAAVEELANISKVDIRLDQRALSAASVSQRLPISLEIRNQGLRTVLDLMLEPHDLTWQLRDGALWVTTKEAMESDATTAVFDVRDLCRNSGESLALEEAITTQSEPDSWADAGGVGQISFPVAGTMVVYQTERRLDEVLQLLEDYRTALRASKRRVRADSDPKGVITRYYRMPSAVADDLETALPQLVQPDSWKSAEAPNAPGTIRKLKSWIDVTPHVSKGDNGVIPVPYSVLIIQQMREVHDKLPGFLYHIEHGEGGGAAGGAMGGGGMGGGGMGGGGMGGGGGFGGGFFAVPMR